MPSSARGWLAWSCYVRESQGRAFSPSLEYGGRTDPRTRDSKESAISVLMLAEKASHTVCRNGVGYRLMLQFYAGEAYWWSFTESEQAILRKTIRCFSRGLWEAGFLPDRVRGAPEEDRGL